VIWASEDRIMPREHGRQLAGLFSRGWLVEIADTYTLIPEDQPARLAACIREFLTADSTSAADRPAPDEGAPGPLSAGKQDGIASAPNIPC
jgi:hypothetical protein